MPRTNNKNVNDSSQLLRETQLENSDLSKEVARLKRALADATNGGISPSQSLPGSPRDQDDGELGEDPPPPRNSGSNARKRRAAVVDPESEDEPPRKRTQPGANADGDDGDGDGDDGEPTIPRPVAHPKGPPTSDQVATWGARYVTTCCPWLVHDDVDGEFVDEELIQGQLRDLLQVVPAQYHEYRPTKDFISAFKAGMQRRRQQYAKRCRHEDKEQIFGYEWAAKMRTQESRREHFAAMIGYKPANDTSKARYSALAVPLLHSSGSEKYKFSDAFTHRRLKTVFVGLLCGGRAAEIFHEGGKYTLTGREIQSLDRVTYTKPNHIATASVLARWALSEDPMFTRFGGVTGIDWLADWNEYMLVIESALGTDDKRNRTARASASNRTIRKLFRSWDLDVFGSKNSPLGGDGEGGAAEREEELEDALKQAEEDDESMDCIPSLEYGPWK
ncbi:hypothetical protein EXIGLDRAFT_836755 [Exidia glandulosa HHB12029]|uniref:Uncharacterized protein n=1 Tax=Exidia glandulosa HHB12029 TaxID=1314781 RepID=A0A165HHW9_EXIGL|nr:hypothetical protein EXIGLDRAFT_836755 [Exidia glandulosa HHB12029]